jgi:hypothetical protein
MKELTKIIKYITGTVLTEIYIKYHIENETKVVIDYQSFTVYDKFERGYFGVEGIRGEGVWDGYRYYYHPGEAAARINYILKAKRCNAATLKEALNKAVEAIEYRLNHDKKVREFEEAKAKFAAGFRQLLKDCGLTVKKEEYEVDYGEYETEILFQLDGIPTTFTLEEIIDEKPE